jgi:hypothetical protein
VSGLAFLFVGIRDLKNCFSRNLFVYIDLIAVAFDDTK